MRISDRVLPVSDSIRKDGPVHQDSFEAMRCSIYDKMALLWVLADIEWLNENPNSAIEDRPSKFFRNPVKFDDWVKSGTRQHDLIEMSKSSKHDSLDGYYSLAQVCAAFRNAGFERDIDKYFFNYKLLLAFLFPNLLNEEFAKWVKFNETSRSKP